MTLSRRSIFRFAVAVLTAAAIAAPVLAQDLHPSRRKSPLGSANVHLDDAYALVVYGRLFKAPLRTPKLELVGAPARTSRLLQATAARALGRTVPRAHRCGR